MTGSPGSPGPDGKTGPSVSSSMLLPILSKHPRFWYFEVGSKFIAFNRVPLDKMAALDPLVLLELEASLESWDSPDPRELL